MKYVAVVYPTFLIFHILYMNSLYLEIPPNFRQVKNLPRIKIHAKKGFTVFKHLSFSAYKQIPYIAI